jgi:Leucine-rich repeat (LRR) protein
MEHDKVVAILKKTIEDGINGNGKVELYFHYPLHLPSFEEREQLESQSYEYSASDADKAFSSFDETELAKIKTLLLFCNKLKKLPESVRKLKNLTELDLYITDIKRLPKWFNELKNLKRVNVETYTKSLIRHSQPVLKLPMLTELFIDSPCTDELPPLIGECTALTKIGDKKMQQSQTQPITEEEKQINRALIKEILASRETLKRYDETAHLDTPENLAALHSVIEELKVVVASPIVPENYKHHSEVTPHRKRNKKP